MASPVVSLTASFRAMISRSLIACTILCSLQLISCSPGKFIARNAKHQLLSDSNLRSAHVGISIYDASAKQYLYNYQGDKYFIPASNTKLFTCYAAMKHLGDSLVGLRYYESDTALFIQGNGDPSFLARDFKTNPVLDFLQRKSKKTILISTAHFKTTAFGFGWAWDDFESEDAAERNTFPIRKNMASFRLQNDSLVITPDFLSYMLVYDTAKITSGINVSRSQHVNQFYISKGTARQVWMPYITNRSGVDILQNLRELLQTTRMDFGTPPVNAGYPGVICSQPTDSVLKPMMHRSDNFFAEQMLLMVSNEMTGVMNDEKIIDSLLRSDFKDLPQKPRWVDGSGLSRYNLFSPQDMVTVLNKMKNDFAWNRITNIFATGGEGTIRNYYINLKDRIFAKTGTLSNNVALSGFLLTKKNRTLIFSVIVNNHMGNTTQIRKAVEKFLTTIAENY